MKALLALLLAGKMGKILRSRTPASSLRGTVVVHPDALLPSNQLKARYAAEYLGLVIFLTLIAFETRGDLAA
jgi:hypothetical protein